MSYRNRLLDPDVPVSSPMPHCKKELILLLLTNTSPITPPLIPLFQPVLP
jgi:hypothetical protein